MNRKERERLCEKSLKAFGIKYRWKHLLDKGKWWPQKDGTKRWIPLTLEAVEKIMDLMIAQKEERNAASSTENESGVGSEVR